MKPCTNCGEVDSHKSHCYRGMKNMQNAICGPVKNTIWDMKKLNKKTISFCKKFPYKESYKEDITKSLLSLISNLNRLIINNKINLPEPNIEINPEATIDFVWFNRKNQSALGFTIVDSIGQNDVLMHFLVKNKSQDIYNPSEHQIINTLHNFCANNTVDDKDLLDKYWIRQYEIKKILSETDPQKYPNSISEKKLSSEEKLELIKEIVSSLRCDFTDAEHQIDCHADTLPDVFRDLMSALDKINNTTCMSFEEINEMEFGL